MSHDLSDNGILVERCARRFGVRRESPLWISPPRAIDDLYDGKRSVRFHRRERTRRRRPVPVPKRARHREAVTLKRIRVLHILSSQRARSWAGEYVW